MAASPEPEPMAGRRAYDPSVPPEVKLYVEEEVRGTRHGLRNEIAALGTVVATAQLQATREHGEVHAEIQALRADITKLREDLSQVIPLRDRVTDLEQADRVDEAREDARDELLSSIDKGRKQIIGTAIALAALIVSAAGVLLAVLT